MKYLGLITLFFMVQFSYANIAILNGLKHEYSSSGDSISGEIDVKNISDAQQKIILYLQDILIPCNQDVVFSEPGSSVNSLNNWISIENNEVILEPGEVRKIRYKIVFPKNITPMGYWSMIMVEGQTPLSEQELKSIVTVSSKIRYGVQIICNLANDFDQALQIEDAKYTPVTGTVEVTLSNPSDYVAKSSLSIEIYNKESELISDKSSQKVNIYPDSCRTIKMPLDTPPGSGKYTCIIMMDHSSELTGTSFEFIVE
ncbi:COG1470 family protein [Tenacibaculum gallaicum]|nr:hypothetical protein [Tenacibaculum gallaicum]